METWPPDSHADRHCSGGAHADPAGVRLSRWRWAGYAVVAAAMALGFWGYFSPGLRLNWETLVALCGF